MRLRIPALALGLSVLAWSVPAAAQTPGVTATEIKIGSTQPLSGPASAYGVVAASTEAYFTRLNEAGGIHGRKITWLPMDDAFTPAKTVEQTRKLVEQEGVFMIFAPQGTAASSSVTKYLNAKKVPQFFVNSGSHLFQNPKDLPWTVPTCRPTTASRASTPSTSWPTSPTPRSACSTRTTTSAATTCAASRPAWVTRPRRWSSANRATR